MIDAIARVESRMAAIEQRFSASGFAAALAQADAVAGSAGADAAGTATAAAAPASAWAAGLGGMPGLGEAVGVGGASGQIGTMGPPAVGWQRALPPAAAAVLPQLEAAAAAAGIDPRLLAAVTWAESGFDAHARSPAGAVGLTQLMPATAAELGVDPHDVAQNLVGGARYLRQQLDRFGSVELALAAYNAGPGRVARAGGVPAIAETQRYVARVTGHLAALGAATSNPLLAVAPLGGAPS